MFTLYLPGRMYSDIWRLQVGAQRASWPATPGEWVQTVFYPLPHLPAQVMLVWSWLLALLLVGCGSPWSRDPALLERGTVTKLFVVIFGKLSLRFHHP